MISSLDLTMIIFYDPDCGHCKEIPVIKQNWRMVKWRNKYRSHGKWVRPRKMVDFINTYDIGDWINNTEFKTFVDGEFNRQTTLMLPFPYIKQLYDINGTPKVYLLDNNKNIWSML